VSEGEPLIPVAEMERMMKVQEVARLSALSNADTAITACFGFR
jgi:hypothetical protein